MSCELIPQTEAAYSVSIHSSGPREEIKNVCRAECSREGLCVTVEPTLFIYTGGEEQGAKVGLISYPRYPRNPSEVWERAASLAEQLLTKCYQRSILLTDGTKTKLITIREDAV